MRIGCVRPQDLLPPAFGGDARPLVGYGVHADCVGKPARAELDGRRPFKKHPARGQLLKIGVRKEVDILAGEHDRELGHPGVVAGQAEHAEKGAPGLFRAAPVTAARRRVKERDRRQGRRGIPVRPARLDSLEKSLIKRLVAAQDGTVRRAAGRLVGARAGDPVLGAVTALED